MTERVTIGFVCVQNAGRSQMATAFAQRERTERGLEDAVEIITGGTRPAEAVHDLVIDVMDEVGIDLSDRVPRSVDMQELNSCRVVATMGCSTLELNAETDVRDWALPDPDGAGIEDVRAIRAEIEANVDALFDEIEAELDDRT